MDVWHPLATGALSYMRQEKVSQKLASKQHLCIAASLVLFLPQWLPGAWNYR